MDSAACTVCSDTLSKRKPYAKRYYAECSAMFEAENVPAHVYGCTVATHVSVMAALHEGSRRHVRADHRTDYGCMDARTYTSSQTRRGYRTDACRGSTFEASTCGDGVLRHVVSCSLPVHPVTRNHRRKIARKIASTLSWFSDVGKRKRQCVGLIDVQIAWYSVSLRCVTFGRSSGLRPKDDISGRTNADVTHRLIDNRRYANRRKAHIYTSFMLVIAGTMRARTKPDAHPFSPCRHTRNSRHFRCSTLP